MSRLSPRLLRRAERGGAAMIVVILLGGGVLLGASALAVDVGNMMFERRQLQNGADAASRRLAAICAGSLNDCSVTKPATVSSVGGINSSNASDSVAALNTTRPGVPTGMCGRAPGALNLPACPADALNAVSTQWTECPALPTAFANGTAPYVQVYTLTATSSSSGVLSSFFGLTDSSPGACARYAWGLLKSSSTFPLTIALCEYLEAVTPPTGNFGTETSIPLKYKSNPQGTTSCDPNMTPSGGDYNGGFGWLSNTNCIVPTGVPGWADGNTGVGAGNACVANLVLNQVYLLPVYTCVSDSNVGTASPCVPGSPGGTNTWYYLKQYVAFQLTGYRLTTTGGWVGNPSNTAKQECNNESLDNKCITGFFIKDYVAGDGDVDPNTPGGSSGPFGLQPIG